MQSIKDSMLALGLVAVTFALALAVIVAASSSGSAETAADAPGVGSEAGQETGGDVAAGTTLEVSLTEFAISGSLTAATGQVSISVMNDGAIAHNLSILGKSKTADLNGGQSAVLDLGTLAAGTYTVICDIPGHREAGMEAELVVAEGVAASGDGTNHDEIDYAALDAAMTNSILAFPATTEGVGNQTLEPTILADGTKYFELTTEITEWETEPGKIVQAWSYNGQVPGPAIRVEVGDKVRIRIINNLPMGTDVHWHGIRTPNSEDGVAPLTQELIEAGTEYEYNFVAERLSTGMYHAHHHGQMQVPNGLFGLFQIGEIAIPRGQTISGVTIPEDIVIAQDIPMVLNDAGVIGYSLNGKSFPATQPYVVTKGDWITITYYNEGLQIHPMHMHQFPQLVISKDGFALDQPYYADTVNVAPGERYTVLVNPDTVGAWVWHCHILSHVERDTGMFGMVTALIVQEA